jgi:hypothetical protein
MERRVAASNASGRSGCPSLVGGADRSCQCSFGSQSERGLRFTEQILNVVSTLPQQNRNVSVIIVTWYPQFAKTGRDYPQYLYRPFRNPFTASIKAG